MSNDIHDPLDALLSSAVLSLRSHLPPNQDASVSVFIDPTLNHTICDDAIVQNALSNGVLQRVPLSIAHDDIDPEAMPPTGPQRRHDKSAPGSLEKLRHDLLLSDFQTQRSYASPMAPVDRSGTGILVSCGICPESCPPSSGRHCVMQSESG